MSGFKRRTSAAEAGQIRQIVEALTPVPENPAPPPRREAAPPVDDRKVSPEKLPDVNTPAVGDAVREVPIAAIRENPFNARRVRSGDELKDLAASMAKEGQLVPAPAFLDRGGSVTLIDGHHRLRAAQIAGLKTFRVDLRPAPVSDADLYLQSRRFNVERIEQTVIDDALAWRMLIDRRVFSSQQDLADAVGISKAVVSKTLSLAEFPESVRAAVVEIPGMLTLRALYELYLFFTSQGEGETLRLLASAREQGISARELAARRAAAERGKIQRPRSARRSFSFGGNTGEIRRFDVDGRLELRIKGLAERDLIELEDRIGQLLAAQPELPLD